MTEENHRVAAIDAATLLTGSVDGLIASVDHLVEENQKNKRYSRSSRHLIYGLIVAAVVGFALTVITVLAVVSAHDSARKALAATDAAHTNATAIYVACEATNAGRAATLAFFEKIVALVPPNPTPAQTAELATFRQLFLTLQPRVCVKPPSR